VSVTNGGGGLEARNIHTHLSVPGQAPSPKRIERRPDGRPEHWLNDQKGGVHKSLFIGDGVNEENTGNRASNDRRQLCQNKTTRWERVFRGPRRRHHSQSNVHINLGGGTPHFWGKKGENMNERKQHHHGLVMKGGGGVQEQITHKTLSLVDLVPRGRVNHQKKWWAWGDGGNVCRLTPPPHRKDFGF